MPLPPAPYTARESVVDDVHRAKVVDPHRWLEADTTENTLDHQGLVTLDWYYPSPDARYVAYGVSRGGDEMSTLQVIETATGKALADRRARTPSPSSSCVLIAMPAMESASRSTSKLTISPTNMRSSLGVPV